jgi:hypothetical protein
MAGSWRRGFATNPQGKEFGRMFFPGMDPYLEAPFLWSDVHSRLIVYLAENLHPLLRPRYIASVQTRVFVKVSELEIEEMYLQIIDLQMNQRVVTVVELVSPTNKYSGPGRDSYLAKQREVRRSDSHLVEIDLLRKGPHVIAVPECLARGLTSYDYLISVNRAEGNRGGFQLYPRGLRQPLPRFRCPLSPGDDDVVINLQAVLERTYEFGGYQDVLRYEQPCVPALSADDQAWADKILEEKGLRRVI